MTAHVGLFKEDLRSLQFFSTTQHCSRLPTLTQVTSMPLSSAFAALTGPLKRGTQSSKLESPAELYARRMTLWSPEDFLSTYESRFVKLKETVDWYEKEILSGQQLYDDRDRMTGGVRCSVEDEDENEDGTGDPQYATEDGSSDYERLIRDEADKLRAQLNCLRSDMEELWWKQIISIRTRLERVPQDSASGDDMNGFRRERERMETLRAIMRGIETTYKRVGAKVGSEG